MANPNEDNKALVLAGIRGVFVDRDPTVLDSLFSDDYRQHNPQIPNGTGAIKAVLQNLSADFKYEPGVRVADGKIAEHWDVLQEEVSAAQSANGNSMFTGSQA